MKVKFFSVWPIFILFLLTRIIPYINNPVPLGYDAGFYLYVMKLFPDIPVWEKVGFSPGYFVLSYPFIKLGISAENLLIPLSILSQIALFASIYLVVKKIFDEKAAVWTSLIFAASAIEFRTFWFYYVKNTFALSFLVLSFYFFLRKRLVLSVLFGLLVGLFHLPTFLILFLTICVQLVLDSKNRLFYAKALTGIIFLNSFYYLFQYKQTIMPYIKPIFTSALPVAVATGTSVASGSFYDITISVLLTILYLPFSFYGLYSVLKKKINFQPFVTGFIICFLIVFTRFFFFQRYFIMLDVFLILFSGVGISFLIEKYSNNKNLKDVLSFYPILLILFIAGFIFKTGYPLIDKNMFYEIKQFGNTNKQVNILSTSKESTAWLMGYTDFPVIAWGVGGNDRYWKSSQWEKFFNGEIYEKIALLKLLPSPLYIFVNEKSNVYFNDMFESECLKKQSDHFFKFKCG